ncbi:MAG: hypothetical protein IRY99_23040, partial [Isosphaeraceae bacterium]|nr:hypothetical protein [Isosphaeraceae bacterium]
DGALVVATSAELTLSLLQPWDARWARVGGLLVLGAGLLFPMRPDPGSGPIGLLGALLGAMALTVFRRGRAWTWSRRRLAAAVALSWLVPGAALVANGLAASGGRRLEPITRPLIAHCRFAAVPIDDVERLAAWCREHTPPSARFIGPPGPKTFRLWSLRPVAFNRAASPYHAAGLADWAARFRDHVGFRGSTAAFARAYLADRHRLERRYQEMTDTERAALARRQGATHILAARPADGARPSGPLELLRAEGRYAVYRLK